MWGGAEGSTWGRGSREPVLLRGQASGHSGPQGDHPEGLGQQLRTRAEGWSRTPSLGSPASRRQSRARGARRPAGSFPGCWFPGPLSTLSAYLLCFLLSIQL